MKVKDILTVIDKYGLVCIETETEECIICNEKIKLTQDLYFEAEVKEIYPERYGKFHDRNGITIVIK